MNQLDLCNCYRTKMRRVPKYSVETGFVVRYNVKEDGYCIGTRECDTCTCDGDRERCDFYPEVREKAKNIVGREYAIKNHECPMCEDCPDGCPLETPSDSKNYMTNYDKLKFRTIEKVAEEIECPYVVDDIFSECIHDWDNEEQSCYECKLEWLKQEVKHEQ